MAQVATRGLELLGHLWVQENEVLVRSGEWDRQLLWNELARRFPGEDPAQVWARYFPSVPAPRAGDQFVLDGDSGRYRSQMFGTPLDPRSELQPPPVFTRLSTAAGGLGFESGDALRVRLQLRR